MTEQIAFDHLVGLDLDGTQMQPRLHPARLRRLHEQIAGIALDRPTLPAGLSVFSRLPPPEPPRHVRTRMADAIARAVAASGCVTYDDLVAAGFTGEEITAHFTDARRAARVERMAV